MLTSDRVWTPSSQDTGCGRDYGCGRRRTLSIPVRLRAKSLVLNAATLAAVIVLFCDAPAADEY